MRRERELDSTVRRPAEAEKFKLEKLAEATRNRMIMEAEVILDFDNLKHLINSFLNFGQENFMQMHIFHSKTFYLKGV